MNKDIQKSTSKRRSSPARTPEAQEQLMINLSMKQAEKMLEEGRAPSQIVVHFLKLATEKAKLENKRLEADIKVANSKTEIMQSQKRYEEMVEKALDAFKSYGNYSNNNEETYDD